MHSCAAVSCAELTYSQPNCYRCAAHNQIATGAQTTIKLLQVHSPEPNCYRCTAHNQIATGAQPRTKLLQVHGPQPNCCRCTDHNLSNCQSCHNQHQQMVIPQIATVVATTAKLGLCLSPELLQICHVLVYHFMAVALFRRDHQLCVIAIYPCHHLLPMSQCMS